MKAAVRRLFFASVFVLTAAVATSNSEGAGGLGSGRWLCGPRGSVQLSAALVQYVPSFYSKGLPRGTPPPPQRFYRVSLSDSRTCALMPSFGTAFFIPAAGELRIDRGDGLAVWVKLSRRITTRLHKVVRQVHPYGAPKTLRQVTIDDVSARRPASYLRLYSVGTPTRSAPAVAGWIPILFFGATSPWTDGRNSLWISRHGDYLRRDGQLVRISASLAARIRRAEPIP